jgi:hypothetical protein
MKTKILASVLLAIALKTLVMAQPDQYRLSYYTYFTDNERTVYGEIIWHWTTDTLYGITRSNDYIGLRYSPTIYGQVMSARGYLYNQPGNIDTSRLSICAPLRFPRSYPHLREQATHLYDSEEGRLYTHIIFIGEDGAIVKQAPLGSDPENEEEIERFDLNENEIVYVEGQLEAEGVVDGRVTLYSTDDIGLPNDLKYLQANPRTGDFSEDNPHVGMIGVVSEKNIIIRNTFENGKENGVDVAQGDWNRHSIVLNGTYMALDESFTFDHQNDDCDGYQGPSPD